MRKLLITALAALLLFAFAACSAPVPAQSAASSPASESKAAQNAAAWKIKIGDAEISQADCATLELVTQTLKKQSKDGSIKDQECEGYALKSVLELAKAADYAKITAVAADGVEYEIAKDVAELPTTMLTITQKGEDFFIPRLAVDGEGSKAWLKDVVELKIQK